jgi:DNA polymerase-3 subunit delta'
MASGFAGGEHFKIALFPNCYSTTIFIAMAFKDFPAQSAGIQLLQRSLQRGRVAHGYLFFGHEIEELEALAATLAKTLNCQKPVASGGAAIDCCDKCVSCRKIDSFNHGDIHWTRPESKSRVIVVEQMREVMQQIYLKPIEADYKFAIISSADRLNVAAANAFLKTLEEPPPRSILILLSTEPQRMLETILSRCLRLNFSGDGQRKLQPERIQWLSQFSEMAAADQKSLLGRYRLLDLILQKLNQIKSGIEETLTARSPLEKHRDVEKSLADKWEDELKAAIESEYRRQRSDLLLSVQIWLRDVWVHSLGRRTNEKDLPEGERGLLSLPQIAGSRRVAGRISSQQAQQNLLMLEQLQRWLGTNMQEALALEVGLLKLNL